MPYRLVGRADERVDTVLLDSARKWGIEAAARYNRLLLAAMEAITANPVLLGSHPVPGLPGVASYHLRSARRLVSPGHRVREPRHLVLYRVAADGFVEILGIVHDRQLLDRAARRVQREADS